MEDSEDDEFRGEEQNSCHGYEQAPGEDFQASDQVSFHAGCRARVAEGE